MRTPLFGLAALLLPLAGAASSPPTFKAKCEALSKIHIDNVHVNFARYVADGTNVSLADNPPSCAQTTQATIGTFCRVAMAVNTSSSSQITLEAWLPQNFTGRFLSTGNGGLGGCIQYADVAYGAGLGFATVGANNGHNGTSGAPFLNHPEVITDFAWRSVHTGVVVGKQVSDWLYGDNTRKKNYYLGCSTGGREGQKSAEMFPDDFDGIIAGSPAIDFTGLMAWSLWLNLITGFDNSSSGFVPLPEWVTINQEVLRQCDGLDGAVDGIIEDPDLCRPDMTPLLCGGAKTSGCLNGEQMRRAQRVWTPFVGPNDTLWYPRMQPGSEVLASPFFYSGVPFSFSTDWFRYVVYNNSNFDPATVTYQDFANLIAQNPSNIVTFSSSLAPYKNKGGKLITYHGMQDFLISSDNSERYYKHLSSGMDLPPSEMDDFYRYFRISGMGHCSGGPGAWSIGQVAAEGVIGDPATRNNPQDNVLLALVDWVENGNAPEYLRGTKYNNDVVADGVAFQRKHCKFPTRNAYVGPGNYTDQNAWKCILYQGQELIKELPSDQLLVEVTS